MKAWVVMTGVLLVILVVSYGFTLTGQTTGEVTKTPDTSDKAIQTCPECGICQVSDLSDCSCSIIVPCDGNGICEEGEYPGSLDCPSCDDANPCTLDSYNYLTQSCIHEVESLTTQVIAKAKTELMNNITAGKKKIGITFPSLTQVPPGGKQDLEIILKNKEFNTRCYWIDIELVSVDASVSSGYFGNPDCLGPSCRGFAQIKQDAERWFLITPNILPADSQQVVTSTVSFETAEDAREGRYGFAVYGYFMNPLISPVTCKPGIAPDQIDPNKAPKFNSFQISISTNCCGNDCPWGCFDGKCASSKGVQIMWCLENPETGEVICDL